MKTVNDVLMARSASLLRDFRDRHDLHDVIEVTSTKFSHVLIGTYEDKDGAWRARIQPAHLFDGKFRAGTFSLSYDQLDRLIEALSEVRDVLSDRPTNKVHVVKPANKKVAAVTQAQAPAPADDQVLLAVNKLAKGLEALAGRLEALEASVPQKEAQDAEQARSVAEAVEWQVRHTKPPYDCPVCAKSYKTKGRYLAHVAEAHGIEIEN